MKSRFGLFDCVVGSPISVGQASHKLCEGSRKLGLSKVVARNKVHPGTNWYCPGKTLSRRQTKLTSRQKNGMHVGIAAGRNTRTRENLKNTRHPRKFYGVGQTWEGWQTDRHGIISYEEYNHGSSLLRFYPLPAFYQKKKKKKKTFTHY